MWAMLARGRKKIPFITALVRHPDIESVLTEFEQRLTHDRSSEIQQAIDQVALVSSSRVEASFGSSTPRTPKESTANT